MYDVWNEYKNIDTWIKKNISIQKNPLHKRSGFFCMKEKIFDFKVRYYRKDLRKYRNVKKENGKKIVISYIW